MAIIQLDFRSDTRTVPDAAMRAAMAGAEVGDDAYEDDPTVGLLEERAAALLGTESALFTASSTMSNLLAVLAVSPPETPVWVLAGAESHVTQFEQEGIRRFARAELHAVAQREDGRLDVRALEEGLGQGPPGSSVVCLENTSMMHGGSALTRAVTAQQSDVARAHGAHVHLDGARLPNAAVALGVPVAELAQPADSVTLSLAKGLGAPFGSLLGGSERFIAVARSLRLSLGGTLHQGGVVAAPGLVALDRIPELARDHRLAASLMAGIRRIPGTQVTAPPHPTNIVLARVSGLTSEELRRQLASQGVLVLPLGGGLVRFVVHREHHPAVVEHVLSALAGVREGLAR